MHAIKGFLPRIQQKWTIKYNTSEQKLEHTLPHRKDGSLVTGETQIKATIKYSSKSSGMANIKQMSTLNTSDDVY